MKATAQAQPKPQHPLFKWKHGCGEFLVSHENRKDNCQHCGEQTTQTEMIFAQRKKDPETGGNAAFFRFIAQLCLRCRKVTQNTNQNPFA